MNESKIIEDLMIELKDSQISNNGERLKEISEQVADYITKNKDRKGMNSETEIMFTRLLHVYKNITTKISN